MPNKLEDIMLQLFADGDTKPTGGYSSEYVAELRNENASWRTKLRAAEEELTKLKGQLEESVKKSGELESQYKTFADSIRSTLKIDASVKTEELIGKIKEATATSTVSVEKAQKALLKAAFMTSAVKVGVRKEALEDAYKLADFSPVRVDLESTTLSLVDKDGKPVEKDGKPVTDLDSLVESMVKEKSYLLGGKPTNVGSASNPGGGKQDKTGDEGFGTALGRRQKEMGEQYAKSQNRYFPQ